MARLIVTGGNLVWAGTPGRGGHIMFILHWLEGLKRLGHEVLYHDYVKGDRESVRLFGETIERWWRPSLSAAVLPNGAAAYGLCAKEVEAFGRSSAALLTLGCSFRREPAPWLAKIRPRILVDVDPGFSQVWAQTSSPDEVFGCHDLYFTIGANIGRPQCRVPTCGLDWQHIWNPVVLDWWTPRVEPPPGRFTTVGGLWGNGYQEFEGQIWGPKAEQMQKFIGLPHLVKESLEIALETAGSDLQIKDMQEHGWIIKSSAVDCSNPSAYQAYIHSSAGEFSCAKGLYVGTKCGWFSDRSECYLAAGRPVIVQDTGIEGVLPIGEGLFSVAGPEQAAEAIRDIRGDYARHAVAARKIATEHFDAERVLTRLMKCVGL